MPDASAKGLLAAYAKTLQAGPTHFIAMTTGGPLGPSTYAGVEDLAHNAAEYVEDAGGSPAARLGIGGDSYTCSPHGPTTIVFAPGYCDASTRWLLYAIPGALGPIEAREQVLSADGLARWLPAPGAARTLRKASIRGVAVTGYAFSLDTAAMNAVLQSAPVPLSNAAAVVHVWIDTAGLVRDFKADLRMTVPGLGSPLPSGDVGLPAGMTPIPNPSRAAEQAAMKSSVPAADRRSDVPDPIVDQLSRSTTVQLWDFRAAPTIHAPPSEAVYSPTPYQ